MAFQVDRLVRNIVGKEVESFKIVKIFEAEAEDGSKVNIKGKPQIVEESSLLQQSDRISNEIINLQNQKIEILDILASIQPLKQPPKAAEAGQEVKE